ncbi:MAG: hypothetical protein HKO71_05430, partial [Pseudomonadales bacterium]|nr:hypothetical protein [Pseudomonadales bacterium]
ISVAAIIEAVDEGVDATSCSGKSDCQDGQTCLTHSLWDDLTRQIHNFLDGISLADLVERREIQQVSARQNNAYADANIEQVLHIAARD